MTEWLTSLGIGFLGGLAVGVVLAMLLGFVVYSVWLRPAAVTEPPQNPFDSASKNIVVLGDSFASGEGARSFWKDSATCHRTWASYAYLIVYHYHEGLVFPACSGAVIEDIDPTLPAAMTAGPEDPAASGEEKVSTTTPPLRSSQLQALRDAANVNIVLVQVSGNDVGFGDIVAACVKANFHLKSPCSAQQQNWLEAIAQTEGRLVRLYENIKRVATEKGAAVLAMGYPNPFGPAYCSATQVRSDDWAFLRNTFIPQLDTMIEHAAARAGVLYIPMQDAFAGFGLCELPVGEAALNTISLLSLLPTHDSFHPNAIGHLLMANRIERALRSNGFDVPPEAAPPETAASATDQPQTSAVPEASTVAPRRDSSPCDAGEPIGVTYPVGSANVALSEALPGSTVCYRLDGGAWAEVTADKAGRVLIAAASADATRIEVVFQGRLKDWTRNVYEVVP